uniref:PIH1 domain containing 2 n=1 Tax=Myripristis murdjan TaxID=586833 RepID=A0A667YC76_9TELE
MGSSGCPEDVLQHVSQFWSMLDDLSESDPAAYQELIGKQMERGADMLSAPPEPVCCLQTEILEPNQGLLYINICGWKRVPAPQDPSKPIPLCENNKKTLIQVISSTVTAQPLKPEYQLQVNTDAAGSPCSLELTVELPRVSSISECQLSISKDDILLQVEDVYYLLLELPQNVNEESAAATFNKKKRRLTLKVPVL